MEIRLTFSLESPLIHPEGFWVNRHGRQIRADRPDLYLEQDTDQLTDLLRKMLRINPKE